MSFTTSNRKLPLWETVAYREVPIFRALALALEHAGLFGFVLQLWTCAFSACETKPSIFPPSMSAVAFACP